MNAPIIAKRTHEAAEEMLADRAARKLERQLAKHPLCTDPQHPGCLACALYPLDESVENDE